MTAPVPDHAARPAAELRVTPPALLDPIEFWTCDDGAEQLSTTELEEAVLEHLEGWSEKSGPEFETFLRGIAPLTVYGYSRAEVTDERLHAEAALMVERLSESLEEDEEWGDPDGRHTVFDDLGQNALLILVIEALKKVRHHIEPWHCEVTKTVVLDADELVALVRELEPEWFKDAAKR